MKTLDFERTKPPAPDHDVDAAAIDIMDILKQFDSPKDAAAALTLSHFYMIKAAFPPEFAKEAIVAIDAHNTLLKQFIAEGWQ